MTQENIQNDFDPFIELLGIDTASTQERPDDIVSLNVDCFLLDSGNLYLYNNKMVIIDSIANEYSEESIYMIDLKSIDNEKWEITAWSNLDTVSGWALFEEGLFGVYSANYDFSFQIYNEPYETSSIVFSSTEYVTSPLQVIKIVDDWILINFFQNNTNYSGWVKRSEICPNPYSTCN